MIHVELNCPVVLFSQLPELSEKLGVDLKQLQMLANSAANVVTKDVTVGEGDAAKTYHKGDILSDKEMIEAQAPHLYGSEGVVWLCALKGIECNPITVIDLNRDVYYEATDNQWLDISYAVAQVEAWNERIARLTDLHAPEIILRNEARMLREKVEVLESNRYARPLTHKDGTLCRALNDIGYSLLHGWDAEMLEEFERRDEERAQEYEMAANGEMQEAN